MKLKKDSLSKVERRVAQAQARVNKLREERVRADTELGNAIEKRDELKLLEQAQKTILLCCDRNKQKDLFYCLGWQYERKHLYEKALEMFERGIKLDPSNSMLWWSKGGVLWNLDRKKEAQRCFDKEKKLQDLHGEHQKLSYEIEDELCYLKSCCPVCCPIIVLREEL